MMPYPLSWPVDLNCCCLLLFLFFPLQVHHTGQLLFFGPTSTVWLLFCFFTCTQKAAMPHTAAVFLGLSHHRLIVVYCFSLIVPGMPQVDCWPDSIGWFLKKQLHLEGSHAIQVDCCFSFCWPTFCFCWSMPHWLIVVPVSITADCWFCFSCCC